MENLFTLPVNVQIMLISGLLGHFLSSAGRERLHLWERSVSVFVFGTLGGLGLLVFEATIEINTSQLETAFISMLCAAVLGGLWRKYLDPLSSYIFGYIGLYHSDHRETAWDSFSDMTRIARIDYVDIKLKDGTTLVSEGYRLKSRGVPDLYWYALNRDGVSVYITSKRLDGIETIFEPIEGEEGFRPDIPPSLSYVPIDQIERITVGQH